MASNNKQHISSNNYPQHNGHANSSSALANGHGHTNGPHNGLTNGHGHHGVGLANGHSHHTNGFASNGHSNGYNTNDTPELVAIPEMCSYCFDVLDCELNNIRRPVEPTFTNDS